MPPTSATYISLPLATTFIDHSSLLVFGVWGKQMFIHSFMKKAVCLLGGYGDPWVIGEAIGKAIGEATGEEY